MRLILLPVIDQFVPSNSIGDKDKNYLPRYSMSTQLNVLEVVKLAHNAPKTAHTIQYWGARIGPVIPIIAPDFP